MMSVCTYILQMMIQMRSLGFRLHPQGPTSLFMHPISFRRVSLPPLPHLGSLRDFVDLFGVFASNSLFDVEMIWNNVIGACFLELRRSYDTPDLHAATTT